MRMQLCRSYILCRHLSFKCFPITMQTMNDKPLSLGALTLALGSKDSKFSPSNSPYLQSPCKNDPTSPVSQIEQQKALHELLSAPGTPSLPRPANFLNSSSSSSTASVDEPPRPQRFAGKTILIIVGSAAEGNQQQHTLGPFDQTTALPAWQHASILSCMHTPLACNSSCTALRKHHHFHYDHSALLRTEVQRLLTRLCAMCLCAEWWHAWRRAARRSTRRGAGRKGCACAPGR